MEAEMIYEWRHRRRMRQDDLARLLGVSQRTVSKWERGDAPIPAGRMPQIVAALIGGAPEPRARRRRQKLAA
jgi:transcriptional regulator with XRE-family HTH domain